MGRPAKLTKYSVEYALAKTRAVTGAAAYAGVNRRSFQRAMQRFGLAFAAVSDRFTALLEPVAARPMPTTEPEPVAIPAKPVEPKLRLEKNILKLSVNDFTGQCCGDAGRTSFVYGLLPRYRRLRGK